MLKENSFCIQVYISKYANASVKRASLDMDPDTVSTICGPQFTDQPFHSLLLLFHLTVCCHVNLTVNSTVQNYLSEFVMFSQLCLNSSLATT